MYSITITKKTKGNPVEWITEVTGSIHFKLQNEIKLSAQATAEIMRRILLQSGYKLDKLANAIQATEIEGTGFSKNSIGMEIGRLVDLPKDEKGRDYWSAFNDGWLPPKNWGYFTSGSGLSGDKAPPNAGSSGQNWIHTGKERGSYYMRPQKPIQPLRFVDIGADALKNHIEKKIAQFIKELSTTSL